MKKKQKNAELKTPGYYLKTGQQHVANRRHPTVCREDMEKSGSKRQNNTAKCFQ